MGADARRKRAPSQEHDLRSRAPLAGSSPGSGPPASRSHPASVGGGWKLSDAQWAAQNVSDDKRGCLEQAPGPTDSREA